MRIKKFSLTPMNPMNILKSYFPPGYPRNIWHLLLLITALLATLFIVVDLVFSLIGSIMGLVFTYRAATLPTLLLMLGFVVLAIFCFRKAAGCVRYWALFLWFGLFLMFAATFCSSGFSNGIDYKLFHLLASILLFVFFRNLGHFNRRIGVRLLLLCVVFSGAWLYSSVWLPHSSLRSWYFSGGMSPPYSMSFFEVFRLIVGDFIVPVSFAVFITLYCFSAFLALKAKELPGFGWLAAGVLLPLFGVLAFLVFGLFLGGGEAAGFAALPYFIISLLTYPILLTVGASLFTLTMDPLELEKRLRKAAPPKEVE